MTTDKSDIPNFLEFIIPELEALKQKIIDFRETKLYEPIGIDENYENIQYLPSETKIIINYFLFEANHSNWLLSKIMSLIKIFKLRNKMIKRIREKYSPSDYNEILYEFLFDLPEGLSNEQIFYDYSWDLDDIVYSFKRKFADKDFEQFISTIYEINSEKAKERANGYKKRASMEKISERLRKKRKRK
ncbi:MAG: hypothetical protein EAX96_06155 [Candidatus Lokiarchaeota archaeon]|nr:hypothetical protein [Candidatus Lokiarchaeota archaeon]